MKKNVQKPCYCKLGDLWKRIISELKQDNSVKHPCECCPTNCLIKEMKIHG